MICCTKMALVNIWVLRGACWSSRRSSWPTTGSSSGPALFTRRLCSINLRTRGRRAKMETQTPHSLSLQQQTKMSQPTHGEKVPFPYFLKLKNVFLRNMVFSDKTPQIKANNWVSSELILSKSTEEPGALPNLMSSRKPGNQHFPGLNRTFLKSWWSYIIQN